MEQLCKNIKYIPLLTSLNFSNNSIGNNGMESLFNNKIYLQNLEYLNISGI